MKTKLSFLAFALAMLAGCASAPKVTVVNTDKDSEMVIERQGNITRVYNQPKEQKP